MSNLLQSIAPEFIDFILDEGFSIVNLDSNSQQFGNTFIVLDSVAFKLRIYQDRGQRFVDISNDGNDWHKLEYVLEFLDPSYSQKWFGEPPKFDKLVMVLKKNKQAVSNLLKDKSIMPELVSFEKQKSQELIAHIFKKQTSKPSIE